VVLRLRVGGLVVVGDHGLEVAGRLVGRDGVELSAPEVGEQHRIELAGGEVGDLRVVELLFETHLVCDARARERCRRDGGAGQPVGVDVRGEQHGVGFVQPARAGVRPRVEFRYRSHYPWVVAASDLSFRNAPAARRGLDRAGSLE
jgi:hypothetical protein